MDIVVAKKVDLLRWLRGDSLILEHVQAKKLITQDDYENVNSVPDPSDKAKRLLNKIIYKGDETCINFLILLKNEKVNEFCPELRNWIATVNLPSGEKSGTATSSNSSQTAMQNVTDYLPFFKTNRSKLINTVTNVDKIIDELEFHDEMMSNIQAERTLQAKMRKIIDYTKTRKAAERLYNALKEHESEVMEELGE